MSGAEDGRRLNEARCREHLEIWRGCQIIALVPAAGWVSPPADLAVLRDVDAICGMPEFVLGESFPDCWWYQIESPDASVPPRIYVEVELRNGHEAKVLKVLIYKYGSNAFPLAVASALAMVVREHDLELWSLAEHDRVRDELVTLEEAFEWWTRGHGSAERPE